MIHKTYSIWFALFISCLVFAQESPLKIGVVGLSHSHVHGILSGMDREDIKIVGIVEANSDLAKRYSEQYGYPMSMVYTNIEEMISSAHPEAVAAFGSIYEHLHVVEACAPKGIHIMVEKPLAVNLEHAKKMERLAKKHNVHLLTNFETTWYPTNHEAYKLLKDNYIGALRKVIIRDGHKGPKKIGVNKEFLEWLTDPIQNGGGAITDFGCYGANLLTWIMDGKRPKTVTAITLQQQPENNPKVDDDATIILTYDNNVTAIIQASWNWPIGRKDMEVYGVDGAIYADNKYDLRVKLSTGYDSFELENYKLMDRPAPFNDPFALFNAVVRGKLKLTPYNLSSLENNMIVVEILDAAIKSAKTKNTIEIN